MKSTHRALTAALAAAVLVPALLSARPAHAQVGSGGATGTSTLTTSDIFMSVQKVKGTNLNNRDQARYLNHAHCACNDKVFLNAKVLPTAILKAQAVDPTATVSAFVGADCNNSTLRPACLNLGDMPMSQFRVGGLLAETTVGELSKHRIQGALTGSGGATGTGGAGDTGGATGAGGDTGTGGVSGTGGATGTTEVDSCSTQFTQTFWLFIGTQGAGDGSLGGSTLAMLMDLQPPPTPVMAKPIAGQQALVLNWPALSSSDVADLLGYQVLCTRGEDTQVFKDGTFTASFDSCVDEAPTNPAVPWPRPLDTFACSDLLPPTTNTYRLKILENDVQYKVAVTAVDKQGNASVVTPQYGVPTLTEDFYYKYRHNEVQGAAEGGFCSVAEGPVGLGTAAGGVGLLAALGLVIRARRRSRRQP